MAYFQVFPRLCFKTRLSAKLLITTTTIIIIIIIMIIIMIKLFYILFIYFFYLSINYKWPSGKKKIQTTINQKTMIHRREFENKLTKELLKIVHYNLQTSVRLSLFSKDVTVDFQFLRKTVPQTCSTDWNRYKSV